MIYTKEYPKLVDDFSAFEGINSFTGIVKDKYDTIAYYLNGEFHRTDGPAIEESNGGKSWYLNGKLHREDGPAFYIGLYDQAWYLNDKCYGYNDDYTNKSWKRFVKLELLK